MLKGKKILLGITGSIAVYKTVFLLRLLQKQGCEVKVVMTEAATKFVAPITFSALIHNPVITTINDEGAWKNHVLLGRWADIMIIAPASCNTLAKMANGICDNALLAIYLSSTCPILIAPAMDEDMWMHPSTKNNINLLKGFGHIVLDVNDGELASGLSGKGRMPEPEEIIEYLENKFFAETKNYFTQKKILITAGPTYEAIDPVRFIGNHSSGKMGIELANYFIQLGAEVHLVLGPTHLAPHQSVKLTRVKNANEMYEACIKIFEKIDIALMSAAVADYTPLNVSNEKIKKKDDDLKIELKKTIDILKSLGEIKKENQILVGFALETNNEENYAKGKLKNKNANIIVLNSLNDIGAGFATDTNKITIFDNKENNKSFELKSKKEVAKDIIKYIEVYAKN